jgi:hypothetical protein
MQRIRGRELGQEQRLLPVLMLAILLAAAAAFAAPRAADAVAGLDDPARIADRALDGKLDATIVRNEVDGALEAGDAELAQSFVDLAADRHIALDPALTQRVAGAVAEAGTFRNKAEHFARGFFTGEPDDMAAFAGTAVGDLFVVGDIRDVVREGTRLASGQNSDELVLALASAGIAVTAATYVTFGAAAPARAGLTLIKVARKTGSLGSELAGSLGRMVRRTSVSAGERGPVLFNFARDIGRVEKAAGGRAAFDGLKLAKEPRDMWRIAKLAEKEGSRTRAILKVAGRGAIALAALAVDASFWLLGAMFTALGFVSALKNATERTASRFFCRRRERRRRAQIEAIAATPACG